MSVDWTTFDLAAPGAPDVVALATGLETDVPVVLLPVRVETRFDTVEVTDTASVGKALTDALTALHTTLRGIAARNYVTTLTGTVNAKKKFKDTVEAPLYEQVEHDFATVLTELDAVGAAAAQPITSGGQALATSLLKLAAAVDADLADARTALQTLRSPYQRERFVALLTDHAARIEPVLAVVRTRVVPAIQLGAQFAVTPPAQLARTLGRTADGRLLRPDLRTAAMPVPIVVDARTPPAVLGTARLHRIDHTQLADTAEAVAAIRAGLAAGRVQLDPIAARLIALPPSVKSELLAAAAAAPGADSLHQLIAAVPSGDPVLDTTVPDRLRGIVFGLPAPTRLEHRLLVRVYPEPLAVDTHEPELTTTEATDAAAYWTEVRAAGTDTQRALGAWRALCVGRSTRRAAYLAAATEPADLAHTAGATAAAALRGQAVVLAKRLGELSRAPRTARGKLALGVEKALATLEAGVAGSPPLPVALRDDAGLVLRPLHGVLIALAKDGVLAATKWDQRLTAVRRKLAAVPAELITPAEVAPTERRDSTWTRAARSGVLPDRFAVVTVNGGRVTNLAQGRPVPADLALGLDPSAPEGFSLDADGNLVVEPGMRWLVDYDEAVANGMAVTLVIGDDEAATGFDEIFVVGLAGGDADAGAGRLAAMLDAHHFTGSGLSLLPVGTPTNNTEAEPAGQASTDDPDAAFPIERGDPLTAAGSDGTLLAAALGIDVAHLAHVAHADGRDAADARTATLALYAATIGHALDELTVGLTSLDARERLRAFVTGSVTGRGSLPAFRVADEPYGVLPVVALSRFVPAAADTPAVTDAAAAARQALFERVLLGVLQQLHADWTRLRAGVKHAHDPSVGAPGYDAQQHFLAMLGLQATAVAASYRLGVNVADRGGVRHHPELSLSFGIPKVGDTVDAGAARFGPYALMDRFTAPLQLAFGIADDVLRAPAGSGAGQGAGIAEHWKGVWDRLTTARAYELRYLTGTKPLRGTVADASTAAAVTGLLTSTLQTLVAGSTVGAGIPLAAMLARHALLTEGRRAAIRILFAEGILDDDALARTFSANLYEWATLDSTEPLSSWGVLFGALTTLRERYALGGSAAFAGYLGASSLADYLDGRGTSGLFTGSPDRAAHQPVIADLATHAAAVAQLAALPPARVETLTREHVDLGSHRLDAWLTGLAQRRLDTMRAARPAGARIGAYGWVENLRPGGDQPAAVLPASLAGRPGRPVVTDPANQGFVQTPSPSHAVTAAILRSGYVSQAVEGSLSNEMSINLTSARVRTALALVDGVRTGNDLGALLGYRLERFLHEYYERPDTPHTVELDQLIAPLRRAYPTVAAVDPSADAGPARDRYVVDGLAVVRTVLDWIAANRPNSTHTLYATLADCTGYPWGLAATAVPAASAVDQLDGLLRAIDDVANAVDALGDLTTAEAVHQIVRGNHARAAAVLQALAEGSTPPPAEVASSPKSGLPVTHRVLVQLDPAASAWADIAVTPRALCEPAVDAWLGGLLGDPTTIRVRVRPRDGSSAGPVPETSVADLGLRPLDLLAILGAGFEAGTGELVAHVLDARRPVNVEPDQPALPDVDPRDEFVIDTARAPEWVAGIRSIVDVSALLEAVHDLLTAARPATAADYAAQGAAPADATDSADADARVSALRAAATDAALALARLLAGDDTLGADVLTGDPRAFVLAHDGVHVDPVTRDFLHPDLFWGTREGWRSAIVAAGRFGVASSPPRRYRTRAQVSDELLQAGEAAFVELTTRLQAAATLTELGAAARALLGEAAVAVPRLELNLAGDVPSSAAARLATPADLDAWLEGAAVVRDGARHLSEVLLLADVDLSAQVVQLPYVAGEPWLGGPVPDAAALAGRVCDVVYGPLPAAGSPGVALVVDEWTEIVPLHDQTTGVAVHYDQPDATAPQCVLVAVPPDRGRSWQLVDVVATLHDTLEIARNRCVEPEHLGGDLYGQVLPLLVGEVIPNAAAGIPDGARVVLDFAHNNPGGH